LNRPPPWRRLATAIQISSIASANPGGQGFQHYFFFLLIFHYSVKVKEGNMLLWLKGEE